MCQNVCKDDKCQQCSVSGSTCKECKPGTFLLYGKCVEKCLKMFYVNPLQSTECQECHWSCKECLGPSENDCIACASSTKRQEQSCVTVCSDGKLAISSC